MSNEQFKAAFSKLIQGQSDRLDLIVRRVTLDVLSRVVLKSPVGNPDLWESDAPPGYAGGRFRGNWNVSVGSPNLDTSAGADAAGAKAISRGSAQIASWTPSQGGSLFITNNLPYAMRIEYGWSTQAPAGVVRTTIAEYGSMLAKATKT